MANLTHWKKLTNPNYFGAYSLEDGQDVILTIRSVRQENVVGSDGKKEECIVCYWNENEKPMILNVTNCKAISKIVGTPYIEQWGGHKVQIGAEKVSAFGVVVDALRVRSFAPKVIEIKCESCGKNIQPSNGMNAEQLSTYTAKKYGKKLCASCAKQIKAGEQNEASETK